MKLPCFCFRFVFFGLTFFKSPNGCAASLCRLPARPYYRQVWPHDVCRAEAYRCGPRVGLPRLSNLKNEAERAGQKGAIKTMPESFVTLFLRLRQFQPAASATTDFESAPTGRRRREGAFFRKWGFVIVAARRAFSLGARCGVCQSHLVPLRRGILDVYSR